MSSVISRDRRFAVVKAAANPAAEVAMVDGKAEVGIAENLIGANAPVNCRPYVHQWK